MVSNVAVELLNNFLLTENDIAGFAMRRRRKQYSFEN